MKKFLCLLILILPTFSAHSQFFYSRFHNPITNATHDRLYDGLKLDLNYSPSRAFASTGAHYYLNAGISIDRIRIVMARIDGNVALNLGYNVRLPAAAQELNSIGSSIAEFSGGFILCGTVEDNHTTGAYLNGGPSLIDEMDILLTKMDLSGNVLIAKKVHLGERDSATAMIRSTTNPNNYLVTGTSRKSNGSSTVFIMSVDAALNINWIEEYDLFVTSQYERLSIGMGIAEATNGEIWVVGSSTDLATLDQDALIFSVDPNGNVVHVPDIYFDPTVAINNGKEAFNSIRLTLSGDAIVNGYGQHALATGEQMLVAYFYLPSATVNWLFGYPYPGASTVGYDAIERFNQYTGNMEYYAAGYVFSGALGSVDMLVYKINPLGQTIAQYHYGETAFDEARAIDIVNTGQPDDGFVLFGSLMPPVSGSYINGGIVKAYFNGELGCNFASVNHSYADYPRQKANLHHISGSTYTEGPLSLSAVAHNFTSICADPSLPLGSNMRIQPEQENQQESVSSNSENSLHVFPNPLGDVNILQAELNIEKDEQASCQIFSASGRIVYEKKIALYKGSNKIPIDIAQLSEGLYILKVRTPTLELKRIFKR